MNGKLEEEIYMKAMEGYTIEHEISINDCLELLGSIYHLKQAAHVWYKAFIKVLVKQLGFVLSVIDPCLLMRIDDHRTVIVMVHVHDSSAIGDYAGLKRV